MAVLDKNPVAVGDLATAMSSAPLTAGRCPTRSGTFSCERPAGHAGECVTRERATPWVGPAARGRPVAVAKGGR
jgi:hypothetical protein